MVTPSEIVATGMTPAQPAPAAPVVDMQSRIEAGLSKLGMDDETVFDGTKVNSTITFTHEAQPQPEGQPVAPVVIDETGRAHGEDGKFVEKPAEAAAVVEEKKPESAPAATVSLGEFGDVPVTDIPALLPSILEYERAKYEPQLQQVQAQYEATRQQIAELQRQAAEAQEYANTIYTWAQNDPENFLNTVNSRSLGVPPGAQTQQRQPQQAQPQGMTPEQLEAWWAKKQAEVQATQQAQAAEQARYSEVSKVMNSILEQTFPKSEFPDDAVREEIYNAFSARVAAAPKGSFPKNLPIPLLSRKIAAIANTVKQNIGKHFAAKVAAQAAINAKAAPTPVGGGTMIPKREALGPDAYRGSNLANRIAQRMSHLQG